MNKNKKVSKKPSFRLSWVGVGLVAVVLSAPNSMVIKWIVDDVDPFMFNVARGLAIAVVTLPFLIAALPTFFKKRNAYNATMASILMSVAILSNVWAISLSQASYVGIVGLAGPLFLIYFSAKMNNEHISSRSVAGISLAALGAMAVVILPVVMNNGGSFVFYPAATALILLNCVVFALGTIYYKRANEGGVSMFALIGYTSWMTVALNGSAALLVHAAVPAASGKLVIGTLFSGIIVALVARSLAVKSYEHVGSVVSGALSYVQTFLAILLPVFILHEKLSVEMVFGGMLILAGVVIVEFHRSNYHKHHHALRHMQ